MDIKLAKVLTNYETTNLDGREITWKFQKLISSLSQDLQPLNLAE